MSSAIAEELDPVFESVGMKVYTNEYIQKLREENLELKKQGKKSYNLVPQEGFQERVCCADADVVIIGGKKGGGKVLPDDADIITPFGLRKNGDLKKGDIITNPCTGGMQKVIDVYLHPNHDFYEVYFDDGCSVQCGLEHLWKVRQTGYTKKSRMLYGGSIEDDYRIMTFADIKAWLDEQENEGKHYMTSKKTGRSKEYLVIPLCEPVKFTKSGNAMKRNDLDPYVIGAILGDGCITTAVEKGCYDAQLTSADDFIIKQITKSGVKIANVTGKGNEQAKEYYLKSDKIKEMLVSKKLYGCSSKDKFIPTCYKFATVEERWALVQGMMDTDGYVDSRGHCSFTTISERMAKDFQFVIRSLGGKALLKKDCNTGYKDSEGNFIKCNDAYTIYINIKEADRLFRLPRKKERCKEFNAGVSEIARRIVGYKHIGRKDGRCIRVSGVESLYMTNDFIVTHNSWVALYKALNYITNPDVSMYAFRKYEDDVKRGPWKASKPVFRGFATAKDSTYEWSFLDGKGASFKMEHLQDLAKVTDRFRGAEMAYIDIEELPEHTRENVDIIFDFLSVNRNTVGVKSQVVATCNPVGWSNKLRKLLEWYIDPETDTVIPERDGKKRYMFNYGSDISEIAWGNSWEEVYDNPKARDKIDILLMGKDDITPEDMILTLQFIEGDYSDNKILQQTDKRYVSRLASKGGASVVNDLRGVWRDIDSGTSLVSLEDMDKFFNNVEKRDGIKRASADVALSGDFFVIWAFDGHHICDMEAWRGLFSDEVVIFIKNFLKRNGIREENFTYDSNGLGLWLEGHFRKAQKFNNKSAPSDSRLWNNLKSECAEKFIRAIKNEEFSIDQNILLRKFTDRKGHPFTVRDRLIEERLALKRKDEAQRFEIIAKQQMKDEIGHSPDFIEGLFMVMQLFGTKKILIRKGFENF